MMRLNRNDSSLPLGTILVQTRSLLVAKGNRIPCRAGARTCFFRVVLQVPVACASCWQYKMVSQAGADALIQRNRNARIMAAVLLAAVPMIAFATRCPAQQPENQDHDAALTPEQWQQRVGEARRRSEEFVARTRTQTENPLSSQKKPKPKTSAR
jgi:hypothetical protein